MNSADFPTPEPGTGGTVPPAGPNPPHTPDRVDYFFDSVRRLGLIRANDRWVGGVASGIGLRLGVDALLVRAAFGVLALLSGVGFILYAVGWALLPEQNDGRIHLQEAIRGRFDSALAGAGILLVLGMPWRSGFGWWGSWGYGWFDGLFGLAIIGFLIYLFVTLHRQRKGQPGAQTPPYTQQPPYTPYTQQPPYTPYTPQPPYAAHTPQRPYTPQPPLAPMPPQTFGGTGSPATPTPTHGTFAASAPAPRPPAFGAVSSGAVSSGPVSSGPVPSGSTAPQAPQPPYTTQPIRPAAPGYVPPRPPQQPPVGGPTYPQRPFAPTPAPVKVMEPPRKGPGAAAFGIVVGLSLLTFAILLAADRTGNFDESVGLTTVGVAVVLAGLCIAIAGLRGRTSGAVGFVTLVAIIVGAPLATAASYNISWDEGSASFAGNHVFVPGTMDEASNGYAVAFGDLTVDLTRMDLEPGETVTVPVHVGAGKLTVILPSDVPASADVSLGAGKATWDVAGEVFSQKGVGTNSADFETDAVRGGVDPIIHVDVEAGAGNVVIEEES